MKLKTTMQPCRRGKHNFLKFILSFSLGKNVLEFQAGLHIYWDFHHISPTSKVDREKSPRGKNKMSAGGKGVVDCFGADWADWVDGLDTIAVVSLEMIICCHDNYTRSRK